MWPIKYIELNAQSIENSLVFVKIKVDFHGGFFKKIAKYNGFRTAYHNSRTRILFSSSLE